MLRWAERLSIHQDCSISKSKYISYQLYENTCRSHGQSRHPCIACYLKRPWQVSLLCIVFFVSRYSAFASLEIEQCGQDPILVTYYRYTQHGLYPPIFSCIWCIHFNSRPHRRPSMFAMTRHHQNSSAGSRPAPVICSPFVRSPTLTRVHLVTCIECELLISYSLAECVQIKYTIVFSRNNKTNVSTVW